MIIVIGNIIALIASLLMVYSGFVKSKKKIIYIQTIQIGLLALSNLVLGGITGTIVNTISIIRNILCYKDKLNVFTKIIITALVTYLSLIFNNLGLIGLLPLISTIVYIWFMNLKDVIKFKFLIIFTMILWCLYDFYIMSFTSALFDLFTIISNVFAIYNLKTIKKEK